MHDHSPSRDLQRPQWDGTLTLGDGWAIWQGQTGDTTQHRHFAAQAVLAHDESLTVESPQGSVHKQQVVFIEPLVPHRLQGVASATVIFIEPRQRSASTLPHALDLALRAHFSVSHETALIGPQDGFWQRRQSGTADANRSGTHEAALRNAIDAALAEGAVPLSRIAGQCGLSPERLRHVFAERVGMGFRRYVLWRRLRLASVSLSEGCTVTQAAHLSGFADAAHFARTLRLTFGISATQAKFRTSTPSA